MSSGRQGQPSKVTEVKRVNSKKAGREHLLSDVMNLIHDLRAELTTLQRKKRLKAKNAARAKFHALQRSVQRHLHFSCFHATGAPRFLFKLDPSVSVMDCNEEFARLLSVSRVELLTAPCVAHLSTVRPLASFIHCVASALLTFEALELKDCFIPATHAVVDWFSIAHYEPSEKTALGTQAQQLKRPRMLPKYIEWVCCNIRSIEDADMADVVPRYRTLDLGWGEDAQVPWISLNGDVLSHMPWTFPSLFGTGEAHHVMKHRTCINDVETAGPQSVQHQLLQGGVVDDVTSLDSGMACVAPVSLFSDYSGFCDDHDTPAPQPLQLLPCVEQQPNPHVFSCANDRAVAGNVLGRAASSSDVDVSRVSCKNTADILMAHGDCSTDVDLSLPSTSSVLAGAMGASFDFRTLTHIGLPASTVAHDPSSAFMTAIMALPTYHHHHPAPASPCLLQGNERALPQASSSDSSHGGCFLHGRRTTVQPGRGRLHAQLESSLLNSN